MKDLNLALTSNDYIIIIIDPLIWY